LKKKKKSSKDIDEAVRPVKKSEKKIKDSDELPKKRIDFN